MQDDLDYIKKLEYNLGPLDSWHPDQIHTLRTILEECEDLENILQNEPDYPPR